MKLDYTKYLSYRLCYISEQDELLSYKLYFTDNFDTQWGDDWNDRPANCNAESPYEDETHRIYSLYLEAPSYNSYIFGGKNYSVEDMNKGKATWLLPYKENIPEIYGGMTIQELLMRISKYNKGVEEYKKIKIYIEYDLKEFEV